MRKESQDVLRSKAKHVHLQVSCLEMDPATQRTLNKAWVKARVASFDPDLFGEIVVSFRNGRYLIVDGQHRVEMVRALWDGQDQKVPCLLYEGLTLAEEAALFLGLTDRKGLRTFDRFRISITAGDPVACDIERIVRAQGLALDDKKREGAIAAVEALRRVYAGGGIVAQPSPGVLGRTLKCLKAAWGRESSAYEGSVLLGLGLVLIRYGLILDESALIAKLSRERGGPAGLLGRGRTLMDAKRRPLGQCVAACIVDGYNVGRRKKLDDWWS